MPTVSNACPVLPSYNVHTEVFFRTWEKSVELHRKFPCKKSQGKRFSEGWKSVMWMARTSLNYQHSWTRLFFRAPPSLGDTQAWLVDYLVKAAADELTLSQWMNDVTLSRDVICRMCNQRISECVTVIYFPYENIVISERQVSGCGCSFCSRLRYFSLLLFLA